MLGALPWERVPPGPVCAHPFAFPFREPEVRMLANIVVETLPGKAGRRRAHGPAQGHGQRFLADGDHRVTATWKVPDGDTLEGLSEVLQAMNPEIVQVYPALVGEED